MSQKEYVVRSEGVFELDEERVEEWIRANFEHGHVEVIDRETGRTVHSEGGKPLLQKTASKQE